MVRGFSGALFSQGGGQENQALSPGTFWVVSLCACELSCAVCVFARIKSERNKRGKPDGGK